jgi:hypothetical protein
MPLVASHYNKNALKLFSLLILNYSVDSFFGHFLSDFNLASVMAAQSRPEINR